ncbi:MAG: asparagine synthase (glutamine-hydrolyzing) [Sulfurovaceae bacterium]|nr:asparagine synthase (glutamine-hydrolyzing) [Sulfurovaceae bacterium]
MCGVLGQISNRDIDKNNFTNQLMLLNHRGPDDYGLFVDRNIALGHTRLSILDLSPLGHQPMISKDEEYVIVYNGEIYNFEEIKSDLESKGYIFNSHTDTEVILNGFIEYKEEIVSKLNGMFAFSIFNKQSEELFLARDRGGIKPLYYFNNSDDFLFSSEIRALKKFSSILNQDAKILFLLLGSIPEPLTIYEKIYSFPAGCYGYYSNKNLKITKYDEYLYEPKIVKPYDELVYDVKELLYKSVERHLISDAPIGTFLSGGLDSSVITAIASEYKEDLRTLSLVFNEKKFSEEYYQDLVVKKYNTNHTKYLIDEKLFLESIDTFMASMEQPTIDGINIFFVSKASKEIGLKAVLSGVGGDEIFYGYPSFSNAKKLNILKSIPSFIINTLKLSHKYKKLELLKIENDLSFYLPTRAIFTPTEIANILNIDIEIVYKSIIKLWGYANIKDIEAIEDKVSYFELNMYMKNQLLRDTDIFAMANSLEIRVPFLDKELVDYVLKISPKEKFNKKINKIILADATRSILPNEIIDRTKMGFTLPFEYWFRKNINRFEVDEIVKNNFINNKLHWSRVWTDIVLKKFEQKN